MNTFDIIVVIVLALGGLAGFQKGLLTGVSRFVGKIAAIGIAIVFHIKFLSIVEPILELREKISPKINGILSKIIESKAAGGQGQYLNTDALVQPILGEATIVLTDYLLRIGSLILLFILSGVVINLIITVVIDPLAKSLGIVNRGGGLAFGALSAAVGLCLIIGLISPFLSSTNPGALNLNESLSYPWVIGGYDLLTGILSAFTGDIFTNPLDKFPVLKSTAV